MSSKLSLSFRFSHQILYAYLRSSIRGTCSARLILLDCYYNNDNNYYYYLFTAIGLLPGGSGYFTCIQNMKLVSTKFKLGGAT